MRQGIASALRAGGGTSGESLTAILDEVRGLSWPQLYDGGTVYKLYERGNRACGRPAAGALFNGEISDAIREARWLHARNGAWEVLNGLTEFSPRARHGLRDGHQLEKMVKLYRSAAALEDRLGALEMEAARSGVPDHREIQAGLELQLRTALDELRRLEDPCVKGLADYRRLRRLEMLLTDFLLEYRLATMGGIGRAGAAAELHKAGALLGCIHRYLNDAEFAPVRRPEATRFLLLSLLRVYIPGVANPPTLGRSLTIRGLLALYVPPALIAVGAARLVLHAGAVGMAAALVSTVVLTVAAVVWRCNVAAATRANPLFEEIGLGIYDAGELARRMRELRLPRIPSIFYSLLALAPDDHSPAEERNGLFPLPQKR